MTKESPYGLPRPLQGHSWQRSVPPNGSAALQTKASSPQIDKERQTYAAAPSIPPPTELPPEAVAPSAGVMGLRSFSQRGTT